MTTSRWAAAPEPEWVLMYQRGLNRATIAERTGAPLRTVGYHLAVARQLQPGLLADHKEAARGSPAGDRSERGTDGPADCDGAGDGTLPLH